MAKQYFRVSDEVVAAVLYPQLGADPNAHINRVKEALKTLSEAGNRYLIQDAELGYRFLTETETRFEKIVAEQDVSDAERFEIIKVGGKRGDEKEVRQGRLRWQARQTEIRGKDHSGGLARGPRPHRSSRAATSS